MDRTKECPTTHIVVGLPIPPLLHDVQIEVPHLDVRNVSPPVAWQRQIWENKVDRSETTIEVVVKVGKGFVQ